MLFSHLMLVVSAAAFKKHRDGEVKVVKATPSGEPNVIIEIKDFKKKYAKLNLVGTCEKHEDLAGTSCSCTFSKKTLSRPITCGTMQAPNELTEHVYNDQGCFVYISPFDFKNGPLDSTACQTFFIPPKGYETDFDIVPVPRTNELGQLALFKMAPDRGTNLIAKGRIHPIGLPGLFSILCLVKEEVGGNTCSCRMGLLPFENINVIQCPPTYKPSKTVPDKGRNCRMYINTPLLGLLFSDLEKFKSLGPGEICHTFDQNEPLVMPQKWDIMKRPGDVSFTIRPNVAEVYNGVIEHEGAKTLFHARCILDSTPNSRCKCFIQAAKLSAQDEGPFYEPIFCGVQEESEVLTVDQCYLHINPTFFKLLEPSTFPDGRPLRPTANTFGIGEVCFTTLHENGEPGGIADKTSDPVVSALDPLHKQEEPVDIAVENGAPDMPSRDPLNTIHKDEKPDRSTIGKPALDLSSLVPSTNGKVIAVKPIDILVEVPAEGEKRASWFREHAVKLNYGHKVVPVCNVLSSQCGCMVYHVINNAFDICKNPLKLIHVEGGNCHLLLKRKSLAEVDCIVVPHNADGTFLMDPSLIEDPPLKKPELMKLKPISRKKVHAITSSTESKTHGNLNEL